MSYIGNQPPDIGAYGVQSFDGGGTSFTLSKASTTATVLLFIDGVRQTPVDAYSVSGTTLTTTATTPSGTDNVTVQFLGDVVDFGEPSDDSVSTVKIQDDAVTAAKLANSINTEIAANTAKVTNATHTGDVTGATALTIATDAVDIAMLSATGTASSSTFLRGDNAWAAAGTSAKVGSFTKDISDATSSQAITGVGFTPVAVWLQAAGSSTAEIFSFGWGSGSSETEGVSSGVSSTHTVFTRATNRIIRIYNTLAGNDYRACYIASFDSDGFTLTWDAKSGTPTGTISINYCAIG